VPAAILALCYAWLALDRGTPWLWDVPVHESGRYTLRDTIFYFGHFLREIPTDIVYALLILAAVHGAPVGAAEGRAGGGGARRIAWTALAAAAVLVVIAALRSASVQGWDGVLRDLLQMRTRDDLVAYGSHWRFHWLSTLWFGVAALLAAPFLVRSSDTSARAGVPPGLTATRLAWGTFAGLTLVFGLSRDTFTDVRYAGHQAREIMTHGPITLLLAFGIVRLVAARNAGPGRADAASPGGGRTLGRALPSWLAAALFMIIPLWVGAVALAGDPMAAGQSEQGLSAMVAGHVYEHALDYVLVMLLVAGGYALMMERRTR
jgi:hypothetical protein